MNGPKALSGDLRDSEADVHEITFFFKDEDENGAGGGNEMNVIEDEENDGALAIYLAAFTRMCFVAFDLPSEKLDNA